MYLIPGRDKGFFYSPTVLTCSGGKSPSYSMGNDGFSPGVKELPS